MIKQEENLIQGKSYSYHPVPCYEHCSNSDDKINLTDGVKICENMPIWLQSTTVGWILEMDEPAVILFELEKDATLSELRVNMAGGGACGVVESGIRVLGSLDNKNYVLLGENRPPSIPEESRVTTYVTEIKVPLNLARARYVAVVFHPPPSYYLLFIDEIELYGSIPATASSILPIQPSILGCNTKELQEVFKDSNRWFLLADSLTDVISRQIKNWPEIPVEKIQNEKAEFLSASQEIKRIEDYEKLRIEFTEVQRQLAFQVYNTDTLVWEVFPDEKFTMLSLPEKLKQKRTASIDTVVNALEATALGIANLLQTAQPFKISVSGNGGDTPKVTPRVAHFSRTKGARYVADALLPVDSIQTIPAGESKLLWLGVESAYSVPGTYPYSIKIKIGIAIHIITLKVVVHPITLTKETPLYTYNWDFLNDGGDRQICELVREQMLNHRITNAMCQGVGNPKKDSLGNVIRPVRIDYHALDRYIEFNSKFPYLSFFWHFHERYDPPTQEMFGKAKWMSTEYKEIFSEWLTLFVARLKQKGRDYNNFYLQMFDETTTEKLAELCRLVKEVDPHIRMMITIHSAADPGELVDAGMDFIAYHAPKLGYGSVPCFKKFCEGLNRKLWFYDAIDSPLCAREHDPLKIHRLSHWLAFHHGAKGVGFWNIFHEITSGWDNDNVYYPMVYIQPDSRGCKESETIVADQVFPSRRWEYVRMGIEDYMLLTIAQKKISNIENMEKKKLMQSRLDKLIRNTLEYLPDEPTSEKRASFRQNRLELIELIEYSLGSAV